ncbi:MAG: universal stress protein [Mucilaginibacter sp.]|uniref:universal stress protein n=1 Tax=Mucilaginibacter sp. TaxID=1882438 RepID=UPI0032679277
MEFHKILIAIDNCKSAEVVALNGLQIAQQYHAEIALVSIIDPEANWGGEQPTPREMDDMIDGNFNTSQQNVIDKVFKNYPVKTFIEQGKPYEIILKIADEWGADVIVMGTHGRKGLSHLLIGSVAEEVIRHTKKTLVVIPVSESNEA